MSSPPPTLRILIIGAGITGLAAAIALREHAASITILDTAPSLSRLNVRAAGLGIYTCGTNILRHTLGIEPDADIHAVPGKWIRGLDWESGAQTFELVTRAEWYTAHRGALLDALLKRATEAEGTSKGRPAEILLDRQVVEVDVEAGTARTADGSVFEADLIVGADGVRSVVRRAIAPDTIVAPSGLSVYRFTLAAEEYARFPKALRAQVDDYVGDGAHGISAIDSNAQGVRLVLYRCHQDGTINGLLLFPDNRLPLDESTGEDWTAAGSVAHLHEMVETCPEPWRSIVRNVKDCGLWQLRSQRPLGTWSKGRAVILGDASHPMLPFQAMGASVSLEDAEALKFALQETGFDSRKESIEKAMRRVFCLRWMRASLIQHFSNKGPFDEDLMKKAAAWSAEEQAKRIRNGASDKMVPNLQKGADDPVQKKIAEIVSKYPGQFDQKATSMWVWDYISAEDWVKRKPEYVLDEPLA